MNSLDGNFILYENLDKFGGHLETGKNIVIGANLSSNQLAFGYQGTDLGILYCAFILIFAYEKIESTYA